MNNALDRFGKIITQEVRDYVREDVEKILDGRLRSGPATKIRSSVAEFDACKPLLELVIPQIIDRTLHRFLIVFEEHNNEIELRGIDENGSSHNLVDISDGFGGELFGEGWIRKYSKYPPSI